MDQSSAIAVVKLGRNSTLRKPCSHNAKECSRFPRPMSSKLG